MAILAMATATATSRTLDTPELLELILSYLPIDRLLLAQRISRGWHTLISNSPMLQALLYFRAPTTTSSPSSHTINPLLQSAFPFMFNPKLVLHDDLVTDWDLRFGHLADPPKPAPSMQEKPAVFLYSSFVLNEVAWRRKEASWRKMLITSPPVKKVIWRHGHTGMDGMHVNECIIGFGEMAGCAAPKGLKLRNKKEREKEQQAPWVQIDGAHANLSAEPGLRMGMLYDHLYEAICTGHWPYKYDLNVTTEYPFLEPVTKRDCVAEKEGNEEVHDKSSKLIVELGWSDGCVPELDEEYEQFLSEAYSRVEAGPWVMVRSEEW